MRSGLIGTWSTTGSAILILTCLAKVNGMDMVDDEDRIDISGKGGAGKSFHWLSVLFLLLILPSISAVFSFANKFTIAFTLQCITTADAVLEALFLRFNDMNGHEIKASGISAWIMLILSIATLVLGSFANTKRLSHPIFGKLHKGFSFISVIAGWVRVILAPMALFGFAQEPNKRGQMVAHLIMGSAFVIYGFVLTLNLVIPSLRINRDGKYSAEFYDSSVMCFWGIINTFTEHRWGKEPWSHGDYQHTSMGIIWWAGGLLGIWLSLKGKRTFIPALLLIFTGYSMGQHVQVLEISTKVHAFFGFALSCGGLLRIIEISIILKDERYNTGNGEILSFQYFPPFCLIEAGVLFMGANEEQLMMVRNLGADHSAYILTISSASFLIMLWFILCLEYYLHLVHKSEGGGASLANDYSRVDDFELSDLSEEEHVV